MSGYDNIARALNMNTPGPRLSLVRGLAGADQDDSNGVWRPERMDDYVGQSRAQLKVKMWVTSAMSRGLQPGHVLLTGAPGLGKTSMAAIIAGMLGAGLHITTGDAVRNPQRLALFLGNVREGDCVFIDEIHQMGLRSEEMLGLGMEDFRIRVPGNAAGTTEGHTMDIPKCTFIGATTRPAHLSRPLRDRFSLSVALEFYSVDELSEILTRKCVRDGIQITPDAIETLAKVGRETPRKTLAILEMAVAYADTIGAPEITSEVASGALDVIGVDALGLDERDRDYCAALASRAGRRIGLAPLTSITGLDSREIADDIEPYLVRADIVDTGSRGRRLTPKAYAHLYPGMPLPPMLALP